MYNDTCNLVNTIFTLALEVVGDGIDQNCEEVSVHPDRDYDTRYENGWGLEGPTDDDDRDLCPDDWPEYEEDCLDWGDDFKL